MSPRQRRQFADFNPHGKRRSLIDLEFKHDTQINAIESDWKPLLDSFEDMMTFVLQRVQKAMKSQSQNHSVNSSSHSVNGDIAIQWEWSNFDHS